MNGLQYIRKAYGMSLDTLGKRMGITRQTISQWEHGTCVIPESRLTELSQIFDIPEHLFTEIIDEDKQEIDVITEKTNLKKPICFLQHDEALKNERNTISRIDYYLKGKGREFIKFGNLIAFIDEETVMFNRIVDIVSDDTMRPVLYAIVKAFYTADIANDRTEHLLSLKRKIDQAFENYLKMYENESAMPEKGRKDK